MLFQYVLFNPSMIRLGDNWGIEYLHYSSFKFQKTQARTLDMGPATPKPSFAIVLLRGGIADVTVRSSRPSTREIHGGRDLCDEPCISPFLLSLHLWEAFDSVDGGCIVTASRMTRAQGL